jgi:hypothetical protein
MEVADDALAPARGIANGLVISILLWAFPFLLANPSVFLPF